MPLCAVGARDCTMLPYISPVGPRRHLRVDFLGYAQAMLEMSAILRDAGESWRKEELAAADDGEIAIAAMYGRIGSFPPDRQTGPYEQPSEIRMHACRIGRVQRARCVPDRTANQGDSRSLTDSQARRLTCINAAGDALHPEPSKLVMRVRFPSSALIVPALLFVFASAKSLPMPAAIFWSRSRVACRYISVRRAGWSGPSAPSAP